MQTVYPLINLGFSDTIADRLNDKLRTADTGCIQWTGATNGDPAYGHIARGNGKANGSEPAHRVAWMLEHGAIPEAMLIRHHCANNLCCNVEHLYLASKPSVLKTTSRPVTTSPLTSREVEQVVSDAKTVTDLDALAYVHHISTQYARILIDTASRAA